MASGHLVFLAFISVAMVATHGDMSPEEYWKIKLRGTPMPKAIKDLLHPETNTGINHGSSRKENPSRRTGMPDQSENGNAEVNSNVGFNGKGVHVDAGKPGKKTHVGVQKGGVSIRTGHKGKPVYVGVKPGADPFVYNYAAKETLVQNPSSSFFFLEKDLKPGNVKNLYFPQNHGRKRFLPRHDAESVPFSVDKVPQILGRFGLENDITESENVKNTIKECKEPGIHGEEKYCAASLEAMVDFSISKLGNHVTAVSTEVNHMEDEEGNSYKKYEITAVKPMKAPEAVVCHEMRYPYAVFYCHKTSSTHLYKVPMHSNDGGKAMAIAVCHRDTSAWNPNHVAFKVLKIKPGDEAICHFLPEDHIVWTHL